SLPPPPLRRTGGRASQLDHQGVAQLRLQLPGVRGWRCARGRVQQNVLPHFPKSPGIDVEVFLPAVLLDFPVFLAAVEGARDRPPPAPLTRRNPVQDHARENRLEEDDDPEEEHQEEADQAAHTFTGRCASRAAEITTRASSASERVARSGRVSAPPEMKERRREVSSTTFARVPAALAYFSIQEISRSAVAWSRASSSAPPASIRTTLSRTASSKGSRPPRMRSTSATTLVRRSMLAAMAGSSFSA